MLWIILIVVVLIAAYVISVYNNLVSLRNKEEVMQARNSYVTANDMAGQLKADGELTHAISKLFALTESYPDLKANEGFNNLQNELSEIEQKIVYARGFYNDSVMKLNNKIQMFPSNLVANMFGFKKRDYFEAQASERENVKVKF